MNGKYSYREIAHEDLLAAGEMLKARLNNHAVRLCQQYVEKILKECLSINSADEADIYLLHTHKLVRLAERCKILTKVLFSDAEIMLLHELTDYYFDANYPGENYLKVSAERALAIYDQVVQFKENYEELLCTK